MKDEKHLGEQSRDTLWLTGQLQTGLENEELMEMALQLQQMMMMYQAGMNEIKTKLEILNAEMQAFGKRNPIESIKTRLKDPRSIARKLRRRGDPVSLESIQNNLNDVAGIRVICPFIEDIYTVADMLKRQDDITFLEAKDYIKNPKPNGYRSLHLILQVPIFLSQDKRPVRVEIQIRTIAMDFWASLEHQLRYKSESEVPNHIVADLKDCADVIWSTDCKMLDISKELSELWQEEEAE